METFSYSRYVMSRACIFPTPLLPCHALQLNLWRTHFRSTTSDLSPLQVSPPIVECHTFEIPPSCFPCPRTAFSFVNDLFLSLGIDIGLSDARSLTCCIVGLDSAGDAPVVSVVASVFLEQNDVVIGDDIVMIPPAAFDPYDDDAFGSPSADGARKELLLLLLKEISFNAATNGDGVACPICLEEFKDGCSAISTPCSHLFHGECIGKWIEKKSSNANCPLCRSQLLGA